MNDIEIPNRYVSIDIETTALEPERGVMIEFAAVIDDCQKPLESLPRFRRLIRPLHGIIRGTPYALAMNAQILYEIDEEMKDPCIERSCIAGELPQLFRNWLDSQGFGYLQPSIAGKNFGSFDARFLRAESLFFEYVRPVHRYLDPGQMYWNPALDGMKLPDTATCMKRAGLDPSVKHRALEDALTVCEMVRNHVSGMVVA